ncbi:MAG: hypothetical protein DCF20_15385 [Pseudanabaena sp.]|nr:MAG: hypothetical protein DCF20_15385 [Pseudanabaena sp.]
MNSIKDIIPKVASKAQQKFLTILISTIMLICGKVNFTNLSRYSEISKRAYRCQFSRSYNFIKAIASNLITKRSPKSSILPRHKRSPPTNHHHHQKKLHQLG